MTLFLVVLQKNHDLPWFDAQSRQNQREENSQNQTQIKTLKEVVQIMPLVAILRVVVHRKNLLGQSLNQDLIKMLQSQDKSEMTQEIGAQKRVNFQEEENEENIKITTKLMTALLVQEK